MLEVLITAVRALRDHPELRSAGRLTLLQSFACVRLALWDETRRRLISFHDCAASWRARNPPPMIKRVSEWRMKTVDPSK